MQKFHCNFKMKYFDFETFLLIEVQKQWQNILVLDVNEVKNVLL